MCLFSTIGNHSFELILFKLIWLMFRLPKKQCGHNQNGQKVVKSANFKLYMSAWKKNQRWQPNKWYCTHLQFAVIVRMSESNWNKYTYYGWPSNAKVLPNLDKSIELRCGVCLSVILVTYRNVARSEWEREKDSGVWIL